MQVLIIDGPERIGNRVRALIKRHGHDCGEPLVAVRDAARSAIARCEPQPDLVFVAAANDAPEASEALRKIREVTGASLVAVGRGNDPQTILALIRSGADDYLDSDGPLEESLLELLTRIRGKLAAKRGRGRIIALASASGGVGCSTIAVNLAAEFARDHGRCGLIDLKLRGGDLATLLGIKPRTHLAEACKIPNLDADSVEQALQPHGSGIRLLASPPLLQNVGIVDAAAVERVVDFSAAAFPYLVVDLEDIFHREQMRVIAVCDVLLLVTRLDFVSLVRTRKSLMYLEREGIDMLKVQPVANRVGSAGEVAPAMAAEALGCPLIHAIPENSKCVFGANNLGEPVVRHAPTANVSKAIRKLAVELMGA
jgi:pilus assembly protein CpaE